jgi:hypothetical protein
MSTPNATWSAIAYPIGFAAPRRMIFEPKGGGRAICSSEPILLLCGAPLGVRIEALQPSTQNNAMRPLPAGPTLVSVNETLCHWF